MLEFIMKKSILNLLLLGSSTLIIASQVDNKQQPPAQVQQLFKDRAQSIDALLTKAKNDPALQTSVEKINAIRKQLDQVMNKYKGQGSNQQQMPQEVKNLQQQNGQALKTLVNQAAGNPKFKALTDKINEINKKIAQELKNAQANNKTQNASNVRYAKKIQ